MRRFILCFVLISTTLLQQGCSSTEIVSAESDIHLPAVRKVLLEMVERDQEVRFKFIYSKNREHDDEIEQLDNSNTEKLKKIIHQYKRLKSSDIGTDGLKAFSLLTLHLTDFHFQEQMLLLIKQRYLAGELEGQDYALLYDKVLVHKGKPQYYGTQFIFEKGKYVPDEIEDEENVDLHRKAVGLPSLAEYSQFLNDFYLGS